MKSQRRGKKKINKKKRARNLKNLLLIVATVGLVAAGCSDIFTYFEMQNSIAEMKAETEELEEKQASLKKEVEQLSNSDYIEYMARGKYLVSKEGEQVFKFPTSED